MIANSISLRIGEYGTVQVGGRVKIINSPLSSIQSTEMSSILQLQVPNQSNSVIDSSLPPSQTATFVGPMAAEITNNSQHQLSSNRDNSPEMTMAQPGSTLATVFPRVSITFLLCSGKRKTLDFEQSDSFGAIKERLVREWPTGSFAIFGSLAFG